jgi:hypothetical protein
MIPCVILQAAYGGDREPCRMFDARDWNANFPHESTIRLTATESDWEKLARMSREVRVRHFASVKVMDAAVKDHG